MFYFLLCTWLTCVGHLVDLSFTLDGLLDLTNWSVAIIVLRHLLCFMKSLLSWLADRLRHFWISLIDFWVGAQLDLLLNLELWADNLTLMYYGMYFMLCCYAICYVIFYMHCYIVCLILCVPGPVIFIIVMLVTFINKLDWRPDSRTSLVICWYIRAHTRIQLAYKMASLGGLSVCVFWSRWWASTSGGSPDPLRLGQPGEQWVVSSVMTTSILSLLLLYREVN